MSVIKESKYYYSEFLVLIRNFWINTFDKLTTLIAVSDPTLLSDSYTVLSNLLLSEVCTGGSESGISRQESVYLKSIHCLNKVLIFSFNVIKYVLFIFIWVTIIKCLKI